MSIKALARDLYRVKQEVERLEGELAEAPVDRRSGLEAQLRNARSECAYLQRALDGKIGR